MEPTFHVDVDPDVELGHSMLIVAAPGEGLVGATAAKHIIKILDMPCVGSIRAAHQAPRSIVRGGRAGHPIRIYHASGFNVARFRTEHLLVVDVERQPDQNEQQPLSDAIVRWAKDAGVRAVVTPGGVTVEDEALDDKVWGVATSKEGLEIVDTLGIDRMEGSVGGLSAGILNACIEQGVEGFCLLAEAAPEYPDSHAAARIVRLLDRMTPAFVIPETPLLEEAERIEKEIRETLDLMTGPGAHSGRKRPV
ncbi:MAG TPA: PAC2 family protein [Candidatus Thermoplasmatota archaeon]|nr:PAC2 family protein [Candidatus Thermoplasmatota archaeon]